MTNAEFDRLTALLSSGDLLELTIELAPFLEIGDQDARYLSLHYSIDPDGDGKSFDAQMVKELKDLAGDFHSRSLHALAWRHRHGDDVEVDYEKFKSYLTAAALLGHSQAISDLARVIEMDLGWSGYVEKLGLSDADV